MDATERALIDELFGKIRRAASASGPRDDAAERHISEQIQQQPSAPYYMAQALIVQEQALIAAHAHIEELQRQLALRPAGGFLGALFGGGAATRSGPLSQRPAPHVDPRLARCAAGQGGRGQGFLGGAMQTAAGVAGGMLLGQLLMGALATDAVAEEPALTSPFADEGGGFLDEDF